MMCCMGLADLWIRSKDSRTSVAKFSAAAPKNHQGINIDQTVAMLILTSSSVV